MRRQAKTGRNLAYRHPGNFFVPIFNKAKPSVVSIRTISRKEEELSGFYPYSAAIETEGIGSGFVINRKGTILTNQHVVDKAVEVSVKLTNGRLYPGEVVWSDPIRDIALVKVHTTLTLPPLPLGSSGTSRVGELVMSIGNPLGLEHSITTGVISAKNRKFIFSNSNKVYEDIIQTDCAINPGSSGGPLINLNGQVIGMNTMVAKDKQGLGFALGIDGIKKRIGG